MTTSKSLYEFISELERHPKSFLGSKSITRLSLFLQGWMYGDDQIIGIENLDIFDRWIKSKFNYSENDPHSWSRVILFYSQDESDALDLFFKLFKEFRNRDV